MNGSIYTGSTALLSYQDALDVESNNIANVNTVGFKSDTVSFSDLMYQNSVGLGVSMDDPLKNFSQGQVKETDSDYDFALEGEGFFTVSDPLTNATYYTRAGDFHKDVSGDLVDGNGMNVQGVIPVITGDKITSDFTKTIGSTIIETDESTVSLNTFATDYTTTAIATGESGSYYKSASSNINDIDALTTAYKAAILAYEIDVENGTNTQEDEESISASSSVTFPVDTEANIDETYQIEITINGIKYQEDFDTDVSTTLNNLSNSVNTTLGVTSSVDTSTGVFTIESLIPSETLFVNNAQVNDESLAIETVSIASGSGQILVDDIYARLQTLIETNGGQIATIKSEIANIQAGEFPLMQDISLDLDSLGISDDALGDLVNDNGNIYLEQGSTRFLVAKITPVTFVENSSLSPQGDNLYSSTIESGDAMYISGKSDVLNGYLEVSTSDLSEGLVNLMVWQKAFEANSKTITTSDELLQTALALKNK